MIAFAARAYAVTTDLARLDSGLKNEAFHVGDSLAKTTTSLDFCFEVTLSETG